MAVPSLPNAAELRRIIKETTGRDVSTVEVYRVWHYLNKVLLCSGLWKDTKERPQLAEQPTLFNPSEKGSADDHSGV